MRILGPVTRIARAEGAEKLDISLRMTETLEELEAHLAGRTGLDANNLLAAVVRGSQVVKELQLDALPASQVWGEIELKLASEAAKLEPRGLARLAASIPILSTYRQFVLDSLVSAVRQRLRVGSFGV